MARLPAPVAEFLDGTRLVVAGVSRHSGQPANAIFRRLREAGHDVVPVNPNASQIDGAHCYKDVGSVSGPVHGVVVATHPDVSADIVRQCADRGIRRVWFHRSFGEGSVSDEAVRECDARGLACIVGGCPLMYCEPVDIGHRCMEWWLRLRGRVPR